jgi:peroxiredoxin
VNEGEVRGKPVPPRRVEVLFPGLSTLTEIDLGAYLGVNPVVICYTALGSKNGDSALQAVHRMAHGDIQGVDFFGAIRLGNATVEDAARMLAGLEVEIPVIVDETFELGTALAATTAPSISVIDSKGILRIADARDLTHPITDTASVADAIWQLARGGDLPTVMSLPRYYPVTDLVGVPVPDFSLARFGADDRVSLTDYVGQEGKVLGIFFWHPNCPQCKTVLPGLMAALKAYGGAINMVSVVHIEDENEGRNCQDTILALGIAFPVLVDQDRSVGNLFKIISTPTMVIVGPDGIVDSVYTSGKANYLPIFKARISDLLGKS